MQEGNPLRIKTSFAHKFQLLKRSAQYSTPITHYQAENEACFDLLSLKSQLLKWGKSCAHNITGQVTADHLLANKEGAAQIASLDARKAAVRDFLRSVHPELHLEFVTLDDQFGPAGSDPDMEVCEKRGSKPNPKPNCHRRHHHHCHRHRQPNFIIRRHHMPSSYALKLMPWVPWVWL